MDKSLDRYRRIKAKDFVEENGKIWLSLIEGNGLIEVDICTKQVKVLCQFDEAYSRQMYNSIAKCGNKIILTPCSADRIAIYDIKSGELQYLPLREVSCDKDKIYNPLSKFSCHFVDEDNVYLLGRSYPAIVKINLSTCAVTYIEDWVLQLKSYMQKGDKRGYLGKGNAQRGRKAYFPCRCCQAVLELDLDTMNTKIVPLQCVLDGIEVMVADEKSIWLEGLGNTFGKIVHVDSEWNILAEFEPIEYISPRDDAIPFHKMVISEEKVFLFPLIASSIYEIDIKSSTIKVASFNKVVDGSKNYKEGIKIFGVKRVGDKIYFITGHDFKWHTYNVKTKELESFVLYLPFKFMEKLMHKRLLDIKEKQEIVTEKEIALNYFVDFVVNCK